MSYISGGISSSQELFEAFDKMRELTVQSTSTTKLELAYDEVQHAIVTLDNEVPTPDTQEGPLIYIEKDILRKLAENIKARIDFANKEAEDDRDDDYYDDLNDDSDYDEENIDDLYDELKDRNDLIKKLQDKIDNLEKVTEDTRRVDDSIRREREQTLKKNTLNKKNEELRQNAFGNHPMYGDVDSISAYLTGSTDNLDKELENSLKQAADLLSSFEDHLRRR